MESVGGAMTGGVCSGCAPVPGQRFADPDESPRPSTFSRKAGM